MKKLVLTSLISAALVGGGSASAEQYRVVVSIENLAPTNATFQTPHWVGFHDGIFDIYDGGTPADSDPVIDDPRRSVERLAEDGNTAPLSETFFDLVPNGVDGTIPGPNGALAPGEVTSQSFLVESDNPDQRYFSYASMVIPSNDFWYANGNPQAHPVFDELGNFIAQDFFVSNNNVLDAGTEINDEQPENTAFFGQQQPDTGFDENGVILDFLDDNSDPQLGFLAQGSGGILDDPRFAMGDFSLNGYPLAKISFNAVPAIVDNMTFVSLLDGGQEVPKVRTRAYGIAKYSLREEGTLLKFRQLMSLRKRNIVAAHLHLGARGENGPVVVSLFDDSNRDERLTKRRGSGRVRSQLSGEVTGSDLVGPFQGQPLDVLIAAIEDGDVYINVHTQRFPDGQIRGQLGGDYE